MAAEEANPSLQLPDSRRCPAERSNHKHDSAQAPIQTRLSEKANTNRNPKFQKEHPISLFWVRVCLGPESRRNPQRLSQIRGCRMVQGASKGGRTARRSTNVPFSSTQVHAGATQPHEGPRRPTKAHEAPRRPTKPHEAARSPTQAHEAPRKFAQEQTTTRLQLEYRFGHFPAAEPKSVISPNLA